MSADSALYLRVSFSIGAKSRPSSNRGLELVAINPGYLIMMAHLQMYQQMSASSLTIESVVKL